MAESSSHDGFTYRAFVSYSHKDKTWADWLHKALETWRVPSRLVGTETAHGTIPRRLIPIFRDRDELASADSLAEKVNAALAQSENLIVICSPASAASRWVNEEVLAYKRMGRGDRIFCLIVGGEPNATDLPGRAAEECFCPALRFRLDANGQPTSQRTEPIAADARPGKDGKPNAKLRLIAGMLDVGFDALKQREQRRQLQRMTAITALAVGVMAVTIVLAIFALVSRHRAVIAQHEAVIAKQAAVRRQKQAEGLVGFMLGDLNDKLNQVHRLDIMEAVDDKALAYFASLPAADASDTALELRVKALDKIGIVMTEAHGQLAQSTKAWQSAATLASELARRAPNDASRLTNWGESLNSLGNAYWQQGDLDNALKSFHLAIDVLGRAHSKTPNDSAVTLNLAYARNNAGHVLEARGDFTGAQTEYDARLKLQQSLVDSAPTNADRLSSLAWAWDSLGRLAVERGQINRALTDYASEHRIKSKLALDAPQDRAAQESLLISNAILGRTLAWCGETDAGLHYSEQAVAQAKALLAFDSTNTSWQEDFALYSQQAGGLLRQLGRLDEAQGADEQAAQTLEALLKKDPISSDFQHELSQARLENARLQLERGSFAAAESSVRSAQTIIEKMRAKAPNDRGDLLLDAQAHLLLGRVAARTHDTATAQHEWTQARDLLQPALRAGDDPNFLAAYTETLLRLDQTEAARPIIAKLNAMGYRTPDFVALLASKRIDYPANAAFQQRLAQIMQGDAARP
ncbi:MAG TPA: TIR domain-containing protein [Rhodanobacteraceae bacterium]|nr:TIR domain-containing protein [Rhodanobacteraceae bacterium]